MFTLTLTYVFFLCFFRAPINVLARSTTKTPEISGSTFSQTTSTTPPSNQFVDQSTQRPSDDERMESMTKLMKKEEKTKIITQFYPDYEEEQEENRAAKIKTKTKQV